MKKEGFGVNPICPEDVKDKRRGYEGELKGVGQSKKSVTEDICAALGLVVE